MIREIPRRIVTMTTEGLHGREKFDRLRRISDPAIVGYDVQIEADSSYEATFHGLVQDDLCILRIASHPCRVIRPVAQPDDLLPNSLVLVFALSGKVRADQDGRSTLLSPGDGTLLVADRHYRLHAEDPHGVAIFKLPSSLLLQPSSLSHFTARNFSDAQAVSTLLFNFANDFSRHAHVIGPQQTGKLTLTLLDMLETVLGMLSGDDDVRLSQQRAATLRRVKSVIGEHLNEDDLRSSRIAERLKLSTRYLNKLFQSEGTSLGRYIWDQRLQLAAADLADPTRRNDSISAVAFKYGFKNLSHFSSAFRERYSLPPREYRKYALHQLAPPDTPMTLIGARRLPKA